ncbi:MAG: hypothetical protein K2L56_04450, partial [Prevotella sp.]|nr:hypothetical protein [Prevotella sp.]
NGPFSTLPESKYLPDWGFSPLLGSYVSEHPVKAMTTISWSRLFFKFIVCDTENFHKIIAG